MKYFLKKMYRPTLIRIKLYRAVQDIISQMGPMALCCVHNDLIYTSGGALWTFVTFGSSRPSH
jgi:hypothetical protein